MDDFLHRLAVTGLVIAGVSETAEPAPAAWRRAGAVLVAEAQQEAPWRGMLPLRPGRH
jgi:hypothetical protein